MLLQLPQSSFDPLFFLLIFRTALKKLTIPANIPKREKIIINKGAVLKTLSSHHPNNAINAMVIANCHPKFK